MKRTVKVKNLIAFAAVLILLFSIAAVPAYAEFPPLTTAGRRLGSWLLATLTAANITLSSTAFASQGADLMNYLADPLDVNYSYSEMWNDKPTIQIWDDYVTIDGVTYTDIWLSNEAASKFKTDGMDFATAYSLASNTNGTFVSGAGTVDGLPMFVRGQSCRSQGTVITQTGNYAYGNGEIRMSTSGGRAYPMYVASNGAYARSVSANLLSAEPCECWLAAWAPLTANSSIFLGCTDSTNSGSFAGTGLIDATPFDFDYVTGTIDSSPLLPDEGLMLRVPSNTVTDLKDFLTDNPEFGQPGGTEIDVDVDPDIMTKLDDLIDIIAPIIPIINNIGDVQFSINHEAPIPPIPDTPIVDATVPQVVQPIINEIQNQGDIISQSIPPIIESIPKIDEICNNIDTAPYHDLDTGLDHLPTVFLPFITDLRSALGIWHYVTEWIGQISATFAFVTGCLVGTSIMTPIYAAIAGFMCIKVYRRMTG